jgi:hypothetical protein
VKPKSKVKSKQSFFFELLDAPEEDRGEESPRTEQEGGAE